MTQKEMLQIFTSGESNLHSGHPTHASDGEDEDGDEAWDADDPDVVQPVIRDAGEAPVLLETVQQWLAEADQVHGDCYRVCQEKHQTDRSAELRTWNVTLKMY